MDETTAYSKRLNPFIRKWLRSKQRVAIFGIGPHTDFLFAQVPELEAVNIVGYLDNDQGHHGKRYRGKDVHPPAWAELHADIILCSSFVNELQMAEAVEHLNCKTVTSHTRLCSGSTADLAVRSAASRTATAPAPPPRRSLIPYPAVFDIVIFPIIDWHFRFQRPQQLAAHLADAGHRVFYVRNTFIDQADSIVREVRQRVFTVQLTGPPNTNIYAESMGEDLMRCLAAELAALRAEYHIADPVCLVDLPYWGPIALHLQDRYGWKVVYDCMDYHAGFSNTSKNMLSHELELSRRSDLVLASSRALLKAQSSINPRCALLPNAVDFHHFRFPLSSRIPAPLSSLPRPILGYYGAIADWFDTPLVAFLARQRPEWTFVLIGHTHGADLKPIRDLSNVQILPEQDYEDLPACLHAFDVCLIPFKKSPLTHATNPVKLFEYCCSGKPIVASALRELEAYSSCVYRARSRAEWLRALTAALESESRASCQARLEFARDNTWAKRVGSLVPQLKSLFGKVSIIITTFNNLELTRLCLESIYAKTTYPDFEVIVVDNASDDGTSRFLKEFSVNRDNCRIVLNDANVGFARANNQGASLATGEYLVFLNNDTIVTRNWIMPLLSRLRERSVGLAGPVTNWSGNETRIPVSYRTIREIDEFAERRMQSHDGMSFEIRMLPFCCVALRRGVYAEIGPLDEQYGVGMFEDDDYAMQVRAKGYRLVCVEDAFVHHWGRASFGQLEEGAYAQLFEENRRKFEAKWGTRWTPHRWRQDSC